MLDRYITPLIKPVVLLLAQGAKRQGMHADHATVLGFIVGICAMVAIAKQDYFVAIGFILISRLFDAIDGALARLDGATDAGGFLDITLDFLFYALIPLAFAIANPTVNALPAAVLLTAFVGTGSSFLAFAALAEKRGISSVQYPDKSFYFLGGLAEATETLTCFILMCLFPQWFPMLAYIFSAICAVTIATRIIGGYHTLKK
jgi:phosphatidylglycerophosphate synthase